jgi:hypothetical protein
MASEEHKKRVIEAVITSVEAINDMLSVSMEYPRSSSDKRILEALVAITKELTWVITQDPEYRPDWAQPEG